MVLIFDFFSQFDCFVVSVLDFVCVFWLMLVDLFCDGDCYVFYVDFFGVDLGFIDVDFDGGQFMICVQCIVDI